MYYVQTHRLNVKATVKCSGVTSGEGAQVIQGGGVNERQVGLINWLYGGKP